MGIDDPHRAIGGDHLGFQQAGGRRAVALGEAAEAAALDQAGDADGQAAAALHVTPGLADRGIGIAPDHAGAERHGRLRRVGRAAGDEGVMQFDAIHRTRPDQQRVRRVRGALVAVAAALHRQPQAMGPREVHCRRHVGGVARRHGIGAGRRGPGIGPATGLGQRGRVADRPRVLQRAEDGGAVGAVGCRAAGLDRRTDRDQAATDLVIEVLPFFGGRPDGIAGPDPAVWRGVGGDGHQRKASGKLDQGASQHGVLRRWTVRLLAVRPLILLENVTTGMLHGTTGDHHRTSGGARFSSSSPPCPRSGESIRPGCGRDWPRPRRSRS